MSHKTDKQDALDEFKKMILQLVENFQEQTNIKIKIITIHVKFISPEARHYHIIVNDRGDDE